VLLLVLSTAITVGLLVLLVGSLIASRPAAVGQRLEEVRRLGTGEAHNAAAQQRRDAHKRQIEDVLAALGERITRQSGSGTMVTELLTHAGYRSAGAPALFWGARLGLTAILGVLGFSLAPVLGTAPAGTVLAGAYLAAVGYVLPVFMVRSRARARQKEITLALPDAIDLMVVCVEAGLGINQAMLRIAQEIHHVSPLLAQELYTTNLEIRAGRPRQEALRNLTERTGVEDLRGLMNTLAQAERFGTPIGPALRVHAETMRDKRKQRAREAAAKTTIKLVFPLVLCIFPAIFVVIVGPGLIQIIEQLQGM